MTRFSALAAWLCAALAFSGSALAQDEEPPTIFFSSWQCDQSAIGALVDDYEARQQGVWQELVDEGMLWSSMLLVHHWGDEWNYVNVMMADDVAAGVAANDAFGERMEERFGDDEDALDFLAHCRTHRDAIHTGAWVTENEDAGPPELPMSLALSYFACPFDTLGAIIEGHREILLPAAQAGVDAGEGMVTAASTHTWADEWNYVIWRAAADVPALLAFNDATNQRAGEAAGDRENPLNACWAHKDNIYALVAMTRPRQE